MNKIKVLYIEDDPGQRNEFKRLLILKKFQVVAAASGAEGLQHLKDRGADVVLCDLNMPQMSGMTVLEQIKQLDAALPVILLTAHATLDQAIRSLKQGAFDFLVKPLEINRIESTVHHAIEQAKLQKELRQSQASLQMLMESVPDIVYSLNSVGEFISINPAVEPLLGYKPSEILGTSVFDYIYSEDCQQVKNGFETAMRNQDEAVKTLEFRMVTRTGEIRDFEVNRKLIFEKGKVIRQDGIARDISKRKELKQDLQNYSEELEKLIEERTAKLEYTTRQLAALNAVSNRFSQIYDEDVLFEEVPEWLTHSLDFDRASVFTAENGKLQLRSFCLEKDSQERVERFTKKMRSGKIILPFLLKESFEQNKTIYVPDVNRDSRWPKESRQLIKTRAIVVSPIKVNKQPIGVIAGNMQHHEREMDPQDVVRFEMFANMVGLALENIRVYQSLEKKVLEKTRSLREANRQLREKAKELENKTFSLGKANVQMLAIQEELEEKNARMEELLKKLSESKNRLEAILDSSISAIVMVDLQNNIIATNRRCQEFFGISVEKILKQPFKSFAEQIRGCFEHGSKFDTLIKTLLRKPDPIYDRGIELDKIYERSLNLVKPQARFVSLFSVPVLDKNNRELGRVWTFTDNTEMKRADEQLRSIVDASPVPFLVSRKKDGKVFYANAPMAELLGLAKNKLIGSKTPDFYYQAKDRKLIIQKIKQDGFVHDHEVRIKAANGKVLWMLLSIETAEVGGESVLIGALYDIDERKLAEEALKKERNFVSTVLDTAGALVVVLDLQGRVVRFNRACEETTGYKFEEVKNKFFWDLFLIPSEIVRVRTIFNELLAGDFPSYNENYWMTKDGQPRLIAWSNTAVLDSHSEVEYVIGTGIDITQRKQAEEKLRLYREIFINSKDAIAIYDPEGRYIEQNSAHRKLNNYSDEELLGKTPSLVTGEEVFQKIGASLTEKGSFRGEIVTQPKTGPPINVELSSFSIYDEGKQVHCHVGFARDITERKQAEEKLATRMRYEEGLARCSRTLLEGRDEQDALNSAINHLLTAVEVGRVYIYENFKDDADGLCMRRTHEACASGIEPQIDRPILQHLPYENGFKRWQNILSDGKPLKGDVANFPESERLLLAPQGTLSILILPITVGNKWYGFIGFDVVSRPRDWSTEDIRLLQTAAEMIGRYIEHKEAEEALCESEERFRNLVENANDIIYSLTPDGKFSYVSPNWTDILGHEVQEVLGKSFEPFVHPDDLEACQNFLHSVIESGKKQSGIEYRVRHKDGSWRWHISSASPLMDSEGRVLNFIGIAHDVTERKKFLDALEEANRHLRETQSQLVQSEKMASLGMLVAGIAHEINTPIGAVHSMHDTLKRAVAKLKTVLKEQFSQEIYENHDIAMPLKIIDNANKVIESGSARVTNIVRRLRSFARLDEAELKTVDIHEGLEDTLTLIHHEIKHKIQVVKDYGKIKPISCYPGRLNQVYLNLFINAKQAIPDRGQIVVRTYQKEQYVFIEIRDDGVGIPQEKISKIFDPGFTTKGVGVGTGLGLSICYQIIQDHKGIISVESEVGKGSKFTIALPLNLDELLGRT
ncbi:MAG: PAS domain S-box protein [bacterium]